MMIKNIIGIITWKLTTATIEWVELVNNLDQPYTVAHIKYCAEDRVERDVSVMIEHYGDYEEGIEPELEKMLQRNQALYTGRTLPLFYSPKKPEEYRVFLEDAFIQ